MSAEGELEVIQGDRVIGRMGPGKAFGELAILYNCTRTASIKGFLSLSLSLSLSSSFFPFFLSLCVFLFQFIILLVLGNPIHLHSNAIHSGWSIRLYTCCFHPHDGCYTFLLVSVSTLICISTVSITIRALFRLKQNRFEISLLVLIVSIYR